MEERGRGPGAQPESVNTRIDYSIHNSIHQSPVNNGNDSNQITTKRLFEIRIFRIDVLVVEWASWNLIRSSGMAFSCHCVGLRRPTLFLKISSMNEYHNQ